MASGFTLTGLTNYVNENKDLLLKKVVLEGDTISMLAKNLGVKTKDRIHLFGYEATLQNGASCGFSANGSTNLTERLIETAQFKVNDAWCENDLLGKYAEYLVRVGANDDNLPFEADIMDGIVKSINKKMETMIWQGTTGGTDLIDGFLTQAAGADSASTISGTSSSAGTIYDAVKEAYLKVPEEIIDKAVIFISPANFRNLMLYLVENFKYNATLMDAETKDIVLPGTDIKVHKTIGMTGVNNKIYAADPDNMFYGCDMLSDKEDIKFWFSNDDDLFKVKVAWNAGVKTAFPDQVVVITIA